MSSAVSSKNGVNRIADAPGKGGGSETVVIARVVPKIVEIEIVGTSPLVVCAWSAKARKQMLDKQMKKANRGKEAKDPQADYLSSRYIAEDGWDGVPVSGIKACLVNACRAVDGLPMTLAKRMIFVRSEGKTANGQELVQIHGKPAMWENPVRIDNGGTADLRYRARYETWSMFLQIEFLSSVISAEQVVNLVELAGFVEGLCEWRPGSPKNNSGSFGRFRIKRDESECSTKTPSMSCNA